MRFARTAAVLGTVTFAVLSCGRATTLRSGGDAPVAAYTDSSLVIGTLPNGLRYYIRPHQAPAGRAELRLAVRAGSLLEDSTQRGAAHFLEHMAFNGTRRFEKRALIEFMQSAGMRFGLHLNAYTSFDETVYKLTLPTDSAGVLGRGLDVLADWATGGITMDSAEVVAERAVVLAEMRARYGGEPRTPRDLAALLEDTRYPERMPIGTIEGIAGATSESLGRFYRDWYRPEQMAVVVVGDVDARAVEAMLRERFGSAPPAGKSPERPRTEMPTREEPEIIPQPEARSGPALVRAYSPRRDTPESVPDALRDDVLRILFRSAVERRLEDVAHAEDAPFANAALMDERIQRVAHAEVLQLVTAVEPARALRASLAELARVARDGLTETELAREKVRLMRWIENHYAGRAAYPSGDLADRYVEHFLDGAPGLVLGDAEELALLRRILPSITASDFARLAAEWQGGADRVVLVRAAAASFHRSGHDEIASAFDPATLPVLPPYVDTVATGPLVAHAPTPGRITAETRHPRSGVIEWTLSNGARVLIKPMTHVPDSMHVLAWSAGGMSLVPDSLYVSALATPSLLAAGGLGSHDRRALRDLLADRLATSELSLGDYEEQVRADGSPRDAETVLQLVHLRMTSPRTDSATTARWRRWAREYLVTRGDNMARRVLLDEHPRARPLTGAMLDSVRVPDALAVHHARFGNAGDFTFVIAGAVNPDSLRPLVERWLASLPDDGRRETWRDRGIRAPEGVVQRPLGAGGNTLIFGSECAPTRELDATLEALALVLNGRLTVRLREEMGGTYSVGVRASTSSIPVGRCEVMVGFDSPGERIAQLTRATLEVVDSLRAAPPTADEVHDARETLRRSRELAAMTSRAWLEALADAAREGAEVDARLLAIPLTFDAETLREAAIAHLDPERYVQITARGTGDGQIPAVALRPSP